MSNRKYIIAGVVAVLFLFAGYNLYSYFKTQQVIQLEQDQQAENRRIERAKEAKQREADRVAKVAAEERKVDAERTARAEAKAQKQAELDAQKEAQRLAAAEEERIRIERRANGRRVKARTLKHIEGIPADTIAQLNQVSADYILDHPEEFLTQTFNARNLGAYRDVVKLLSDDTNVLMLYAAISSDLDVVKALVDIGIDLNAQNKQGYTALMFAAAYNSPEVVRFLLGQGADTSVTAHVLNLNALHTASLFNPNPDTVEVLVKAGMPLEAQTENEYTPLLLAITENRNFEVAERLADLGADTKAYDERGRNVHTLAEMRMNGEGSLYVKISDIVDERVLRKMR